MLKNLRKNSFLIGQIRKEIKNSIVNQSVKKYSALLYFVIGSKFWFELLVVLVKFVVMITLELKAYELVIKNKTDPKRINCEIVK